MTCAFTEVERERLWPRTWQVACRRRRSSRHRAMDVDEDRIADQSILVVRDADDEIPAFYNTCRHRGTRLANGCGACG